LRGKVSRDERKEGATNATKKNVANIAVRSELCEKKVSRNEHKGDATNAKEKLI
jgi:hypothetical protein